MMWIFFFLILLGVRWKKTLGVSGYLTMHGFVGDDSSHVHLIFLGEREKREILTERQLFGLVCTHTKLMYVYNNIMSSYKYDWGDSSTQNLLSTNAAMSILVSVYRHEHGADYTYTQCSTYHTHLVHTINKWSRNTS